MANYDEIIKNIQDDRTSAAAASSRFSERNPVLLRYPLNNQQDYGGTITFKARKPQFDTLGSKAIEFLAPDFGGLPPSGSTNQEQADDAMGRRGGFQGGTGKGMLAMPMPRPNLQNKRGFDPSKNKVGTGPDGNPTGPVGTKPKLDPDAVAGMFTTKAKLTPAQRRRLARTGRVA